jgi:hypothetical protein
MKRGDSCWQKQQARAWEAPELYEIKMDAEIGSYQEDDRSEDEPPTLRRSRIATVRVAALAL